MKKLFFLLMAFLMTSTLSFAATQEPTTAEQEGINMGMKFVDAIKNDSEDAFKNVLTQLNDSVKTYMDEKRNEDAMNFLVGFVTTADKGCKELGLDKDESESVDSVLLAYALVAKKLEGTLSK